MPSYRFHSSLHSNDVVVSCDGREMTRVASATVATQTQPAAAAAAQTTPSAPAPKTHRDLEETVKKFADAVSEKGRAIHEIWALVFNVLHLLHSTGAERVRWTPPGYTFTSSYTLGVTMIAVLCFCGEHLSDEMIQGLVDYILHFKSVDVNEEDKTKYNWTLLHHCVLTGNARLAKLLIERGACLNAQESGVFLYTPLHYAVMLNRINVVKVILSHESDGVTSDTALLDLFGRTAFDIAKQRGHDECVQLLTQHEADKAKKKIEKLVLSLDVD